MRNMNQALRAASVTTILAFSAAVQGAIVAQDGFGDADRNNDGTLDGVVQNGADTGLPWYTARGTGSIAFTVPTDNGSPGIGFGNAMNVNTTTTSNRPVVAAFPMVIASPAAGPAPSRRGTIM